MIADLGLEKKTVYLELVKAVLANREIAMRCGYNPLKRQTPRAEALNLVLEQIGPTCCFVNMDSMLVFSSESIN